MRVITGLEWLLEVRKGGFVTFFLSSDSLFYPIELYEGYQYLTRILCVLSRVQNGPDGPGRRIWDPFFTSLDSLFIPPST